MPGILDSLPEKFAGWHLAIGHISWHVVKTKRHWAGRNCVDNPTSTAVGIATPVSLVEISHAVDFSIAMDATLIKGSVGPVGLEALINVRVVNGKLGSVGNFPAPQQYFCVCVPGRMLSFLDFIAAVEKGASALLSNREPTVFCKELDDFARTVRLLGMPSMPSSPRSCQHLRSRGPCFAWQTRLTP